MGHVWVDARFCNLDRSRCIDARALIDTGATLSVIPKHLADEIKLKPSRIDKVQTAAGFVEIMRAPAIIVIQGRETVTEVWVSDIIDKPLIGTTTLELLGFEVDPRTGKLREAPLLLYIHIQNI